MNKRRKFRAGFTLAEILIALTVIGIIAALTIPALMASVDEKVYTAQKKAFVARMTNAISQFNDLSGYGTDVNNYAESFIIQLSKVYKLNSICSSANLEACDVPTSVIAANGTKDVKLFNDDGTPLLLEQLNPKMAMCNFYQGNGNGCTSSGDESLRFYKQGVLPAAFTTTNGESVLVYYNPLCTSANTDNWQYTQQIMCVNMIYDLNGEQEPNQVGKDIGFLTAYSNIDPKIGGPIPVEKDYKPGTTMNYDAAVEGCSSNQATRLPDIDELGSIFTNNFLLGTEGTDYRASWYWSGSAITTGSGGLAWEQYFYDGGRGQAYRTNSYYVRCVRR